MLLDRESVMSDDRPKPTLSIPWISASVVGAPYVIGYIIVTIHLAGFNVSPPDLTRLQYIVAGVWSILPLIAVVYPVVWLAALLEDSYGEAAAPDTATFLRRMLCHARTISVSFIAAAGWCIIIFAVFALAAGNWLQAIPGSISPTEILKILAM